MRRFTFDIPNSFSPIAQGPRRMEFQTLFTVHDSLATRDSQGPLFNREGQMLSYARKQGDIIDCTPAPRDKTWCEDSKIRPKSTTELYLLAMENYTTGNYTGRYPLWSKFWDAVKIEHGIGTNVYSGMA